MTPEQKEIIDRYVDIYVTGIKSVSNDAGWENKSLSGRLMDFAGWQPLRSGGDYDLAMFHAIRLLRKKHAKWPVIAAAVTSLCCTHKQQVLALFAKQLLAGLCPQTDRAWSDADRAAEIDQSLDSYRYNRKIAYPLMWRELHAAERYLEFFGDLP
jgi:hypothetical protein